MVRRGSVIGTGAVVALLAWQAIATCAGLDVTPALAGVPASQVSTGQPAETAAEPPAAAASSATVPAWWSASPPRLASYASLVVAALLLRVTNRRLERASAGLHEKVITDPLTTCYNRRFFDEVIGRELQHHERHHTPLSLLFLDVDHFKAVNDTFGHETGDLVLRYVATFLKQNVREADYLFRWRGDEFLVLMSCHLEQAVQKGGGTQGGVQRVARNREAPGRRRSQLRLHRGAGRHRRHHAAHQRSGSADVRGQDGGAGLASAGPLRKSGRQ